MNLENRGRPTGFGEDYREGDFEETSVPETPKNIRDDKMHRILTELSSLKSNVAAAASPASAPAPVQTPPAYANDAVMAELTRLREESARAQTSQEINAQVGRLKDDLVRELRAAPAQDAALFAELRKLAERVETLDRRGRITNPREPAEKTDVPTETYVSPLRAQASDDRMTMKTVDDINSKLFSLDRRLSELSVMTLANDITPVAKDIQALRQDMERGDSYGFGDISDKILDELVVLQNSVEEVKRALDEISQAEPFEEVVTPVQETIFSAKQRDSIDELRETLENGLQSLNEQIADLHADIKIYAEEGAFAPQTSDADGLPVPRINTSFQESADRKMDALAARLDDVKSQLSNFQVLTRADVSETPDADGANRDVLVLDALAEVRYRLDRLETPEAAAAVADRTDEVLSAIEALRSYTAEAADKSAEPTDFTAVLERIDALEERVRPDLVPLINTVSEMKTDADLTPVLDALRDLPKSNDDAVVSALSAVKQALERIALNAATASDMDMSGIARAIEDARADIRDARADFRSKKDGHADVLNAIEDTRADIRDARAELRSKKDDHADVLNAIGTLRDEVVRIPLAAHPGSAAPDRQALEAVNALRSDFRTAFAGDFGRAELSKAFEALRLETEAIKLELRKREEFEKQREALAEERMRYLIREELSRAFSAYIVPNAASVAPAPSEQSAVNGRAPAPNRESAPKTAPKESVPAQPTEAKPAPIAPKTAVEKPAQKQSSVKVVDHKAMKKTLIVIEPLKKSARKPKAAVKIEFCPADAIANQIAHKIALQQLLAAGVDKVGKGRAKRILDCVRAEQAKELTFEADDTSIRRNANRLVLVRLLEESQDEF